MDKATKHAELDSLVANFSSATVAVCADYRGLTVAKITQLRRDLHNAGCDAKVGGNSGAKQDEIEKFLGTIVGPTFVVTSTSDPIAPTKVLMKFAKANEQFRVKGCWLDGAYVDAAGVDSLSKMPGREETFAMLLSLISAPATRLVRVLSEPGAQVVRSIEAYRKKLGGESAAA